MSKMINGGEQVERKGVKSVAEKLYAYKGLQGRWLSVDQLKTSGVLRIAADTNMVQVEHTTTKPKGGQKKTRRK